MNNYINTKVEQDYSRARFRAFLRAVTGTLSGKPATLLPFEDVRARLFVRGQRDIGMVTVPLDRIVGSEGRYRDFDRSFLPLSQQTGERWKSIGRAYYQDVNLPPVELYKLGEVYFVRDGNHRISVARQRGQIDIDAHVIELQTDVTLAPDVQQPDLLLKEEQSDFFEWTNLAQLRPGAKIEVSEPGGYLQLIRHINGHRYFLGFEKGHEVGVEEAVGSWYDNVYCELVDAIRGSNILAAFPGRTEADLYLWIMDHRHYVTEQAGADPGADEAVADYTLQYGPSKARKQLQRQQRSPEERAFLRWSGLGRSRPEATIKLSDPQDYERLRRHLQDHQYYLGQERGQAVSTHEAAISWYDRVFLSVMEALERQQAPALFPKHTPDDLYLLVMDHLSYLRDQGIAIDVDGAAQDYAERFGKPRSVPLLGVLHSARRLLDRVLGVPAPAADG